MCLFLASVIWSRATQKPYGPDCRKQRGRHRQPNVLAAQSLAEQIIQHLELLH